MVYKNGIFYQINDDEGRIIVENGQYNYEFDYKDHLGNTRVSFKANGNQLVKTSETALDPWGVVLRGAGQVNSYQNRWEYQGKEKESTFGLNRINLGARTYNPTNGRMDRVDNYFGLSTFQYSANNPMRFIDVNGDSLWISVSTIVNNQTQTQNLYWGADTKGNYAFREANGNVYQGNNQFVSQVSTALNSLMTGVAGANLVTNLVNSTKNILVLT